MPKGYWIAVYKSVADPEALKCYAALATPALQAGGARFLARGTAAKAYEGGVQQRVVVIEFESVEAAVRTYEGAAYQAALGVLKGAAERDLRIVEGV